MDVSTLSQAFLTRETGEPAPLLLELPLASSGEASHHFGKVVDTTPVQAFRPYFRAKRRHRLLKQTIKINSHLALRSSRQLRNELHPRTQQTSPQPNSTQPQKPTYCRRDGGCTELPSPSVSTSIQYHLKIRTLQQHPSQRTVRFHYTTIIEINDHDPRLPHCLRRYTQRYHVPENFAGVVPHIYQV